MLIINGSRASSFQFFEFLTGGSGKLETLALGSKCEISDYFG